MQTILRPMLLSGLLTLAGTCLSAAAGQTAPTTPEAGQAATASHHSAASTDFLARVGSQVILASDFEAATNDAARRKFYHGTPPEAEVEALMRQVADRMIDRILLIQEARKRGLSPDSAKVEQDIAAYEERYRQSPMWQSNRERLLPGLRNHLEEDTLAVAVEESVRKTTKPSNADVERYYRAHPDKFTEPQRTRLEMILLQVPPSASSSAWNAAEAEATTLYQRLQAGANFAELAKIHSSDESAARGGDLGFLHRGMIPEGIQDTVDQMQPGGISPPTRVLQGYALFRVAERESPRLHPLSTVRDRAGDLLQRERSEQRWEAFIAGLRSKTRIEINVQRYPALAPVKSASN